MSNTCTIPGFSRERSGHHATSSPTPTTTPTSTHTYISPALPSTRQVMNLLQMTVLAGSPGGFLPNMYPGMVATTLARVIHTSAGGSWAGVEVR